MLTIYMKKKKFVKIILMIGILISCFGLFTERAMADEEIGRTDTGYAYGGYFFESISKEFVSENNNNDTVTYKIKYYLTHWGQSYCYQSGPMAVNVDGVRVATFTEGVGVHISSQTKLWGQVTVNLTKGVTHRVDVIDLGVPNITYVNMTGYIFHPLPTYTVNFRDNDNRLLSSQNITKYQNAAAPTPPSHAGYTFNGWDNSYTNITYSRNVKATYIPNTYYITYDANGGIGAPSSQSFKYNSGEKISSVRPTRAGYTFNGWTYSGIWFQPSDAIPRGWGGFTLTAQWSANSYTITYDANGGTGAPPTQNFKYNAGEKISSIKPIKEKHIFAGWLYSGYWFQPSDAIPNGWCSFNLQAQWLHEPNISVKYDRFYLVQETIDTKDILSKIKATDELNKDVSQLVKINNFDAIKQGVVGDYEIQLSLTTELGNTAKATITVHISDNLPNERLRSISKDTVLSLNSKSKWQKNKDILNRLLEKDDPVYSLKIQQGGN